MKIAFLGTPEFALPSLEMLISRGHEMAVFTQPDRPKGRGHGITMPPVKELALKHGVPVYQFERIRDEEGLAALRAFAPELMVTAAFGQILSKENLDVPKYGCINVHGSLLPRYRGAAPIPWAVINGEKITGVTTMMTDVGLDTGDILLSSATDIGENETAGELYARLAVMGAELLERTIAELLKGELVRTPQKNEDATRCGIIKKHMAKIEFGRTVDEVHNLVGGMNPAPVAFTNLDEDTIKVYSTLVRHDIDAGFTEASCGECVIADSRRGLFVKCADGIIEIKELQFAGSKRMDAKAALNSHRMINRVLGI